MHPDSKSGLDVHVWVAYKILTLFYKHNYISVNGGWSEWQYAEPESCTCSVQGRRVKRVRTCTNPPQAGAGDTCRGFSEEFVICTLSCHFARWMEWRSWSSCSRTCGGGTRSRIRICNMARRCSGQSAELEECNENPCIQDPGKFFNLF